MSSVTLSPTETHFTKADVAALSHTQIAGLSPEEMLRVIAVAELPFAQNRNLVYQSAETLRQITHLARLSCRNQGF
jgi:hypothetical protein